MTPYEGLALGLAILVACSIFLAANPIETYVVSESKFNNTISGESASEGTSTSSGDLSYYESKDKIKTESSSEGRGIELSKSYTEVKSSKIHLILFSLLGVGAFIGAVMVVISLYRIIEPSITKEVEKGSLTPPPPNPCPDCGEPMSFIKDYNRWYCWKCKKYT